MKHRSILSTSLDVPATICDYAQAPALPAAAKSKRPVVGGSAVLMGPFVGGAFVVMLPFFLETLADFAFILKGVVLIVVLIFAPAGLVGLVGKPFQARRQRLLARARARFKGGEDV